MMNTIECGVCHKVIAYTNRKVSETKKDFLFSKKLTNAQRVAMIQREKLIYCVACYDDGIAKETARIELEQNREFAKWSQLK